MKLFGPEGYLNARRLLGLNAISAGVLALLLARGGNPISGVEALQKAINPKGSAPQGQETEKPTTITAPTPINGMDVAKALIDHQCQVRLTSPARSGVAVLTRVAVAESRGGSEDYSPENLQEKAGLPVVQGVTTNESGYWRLTSDAAYIRTVWAPDLGTANTDEKLVQLTSGVASTESVVFSGLVNKPVLQDGISSYVRANYFFVQATGSAACSNISAAEMLAYINNPGMADALAGQAQKETINQSPLR